MTLFAIRMLKSDVDFVCANAEVLPFENESFDAYTIGKINCVIPTESSLTLSFLQHPNQLMEFVTFQESKRH